jgi:hypothetical protein
MKIKHFGLALGVALPLALGCRSDDTLEPVNLDARFARYVSMGNSITAGFQSGGINDSTQLQSYAVLLAQRAGLEVSETFFVPLLNRPGCPPPYTVNSTDPQGRVGGGTSSTCALRAGLRMPWLSNVAVPGARVTDLLDNSSGGANALTTFVLGGRTQLQAMQDADPTFVSLWIGNNDVLGALTSLPSQTNPGGDPGNSDLITPQATFEAAYTEILDAIEDEGAEAILVGVADVASIPYTTPGQAYWCLKTGLCPGVPALPELQALPTLTIASNCAPSATGIPGAQGEATLVPWPIAARKLVAALAGQPQTLDCTVDQEVILPAETIALRTAVEGYNAFIEAQAAQREWAYFNPNPTLGAARLAPTVEGQLPLVAQVPCFPPVPTPDGPRPLPCGGTTNATPNVLFGTWFSLDGVHPSGEAHRVITDSLAATINRTYGTTLPVGPAS